MLDSCGNKQHEVQQLDYAPRTKLNHCTFLLLSSLPLWNSRRPLHLATCLVFYFTRRSSLSLSVRSYLLLTGCKAGTSTGTRTRPCLPSARFGVRDANSCCFCWGTRCPSRGLGQGLRGAFPFTWLLNQGHSEKQRNAAQGFLCIHPTNMFNAKHWGEHWEHGHKQQSPSLSFTLEVWHIPGRWALNHCFSAFATCRNHLGS